MKCQHESFLFNLCTELNASRRGAQVLLYKRYHADINAMFLTQWHFDDIWISQISEHPVITLM